MSKTYPVAVKIDFLYDRNGKLRIVDIGCGISSDYARLETMRSWLMQQLQQNGARPIASLAGELLKEMHFNAKEAPAPLYRNPRSLAEALTFEGPVTCMSSIAHAGTALAQTLPQYNAKKKDAHDPSKTPPMLPPAGFAQLFKNKAWWHLLMRHHLADDKKPQSTIIPKGAILLERQTFLDLYKKPYQGGYFLKAALSRGIGIGVEHHSSAEEVYDSLLKKSYTRLDQRLMTESFILEPDYRLPSKLNKSPTGRAFIIVSKEANGLVTCTASHAIWIYPPINQPLANLASHSQIKDATKQEVQKLNIDLGGYTSCFAPCFSDDLAGAFPGNEAATCFRANLEHSWNAIAGAISKQETHEAQKALGLRVAREFLIKRIDHAFRDLQEDMPSFLAMIKKDKPLPQIIFEHPSDDIDRQKRDIILLLEELSALIQLHRIGIFQAASITPYMRVQTFLMGNYLRLTGYRNHDFSLALTEAIQRSDCKTLIILLYTHQVTVTPKHIQAAMECISASLASVKTFTIIRHVHWAQYCQHKQLPYSTRDINLALRQATLMGDLASLKILISLQGADPSDISPSGKTAISIACSQIEKKKKPMQWQQCLGLLKTAANASDITSKGSKYRLFKPSLSQQTEKHPLASCVLASLSIGLATLVIALYSALINASCRDTPASLDPNSTHLAP